MTQRGYATWRLFFSVLIIQSCLVAAGHAVTLVHSWSQGFGGTDFDRVYSAATDGSGNVVMTGYFTGPVDFGGGNLPNQGGADIFLAKYDANGTHQWSKSFGGSGQDAGFGVAVDASGNVFMTGRFNGTVDFGGGGLVSAGFEDVVIAKYDANGTYQWANRYGGIDFDRGMSIAIDGLGNVIVSGYFAATVNFGGGNLVSAGGLDIFVAKFDTKGTHLWSQGFGDTGPDYGRDVAADVSGNVIMVGDFYGTVNFGGGNLVSAGSADIVMAKFDANGTHQWSYSFGSTSYDNGYSVGVDASGDVFATGNFQGIVDFGGGGLVSAGGTDIFFVKYDAGGSHVWSQRFGDSSYDGGQALTVDNTGHIVVTGTFQGTVDLGGGNLASAGGYEIFVAKYSNGGSHVWSQRFGDTSSDEGYAVAVDGSGNPIVAGYFQGTVDFGGGGLVSAGSDDAFLAKYSAFTLEPIITAITDIGNDQGRQVLIEFARSWHDDPVSSTNIQQYEAYRRIDAAPALTESRQGPVGLSGNQLLAEGWTEVGAVAAHGESGYSIVAPTIGDSTITQGQYYSVFFIRAATNDPYTFFDSPPDSGYSVDNLAPNVPLNFVIGYNTGTGYTLSWDESSDADFRYFSVYRSSDANFTPSPATLVHNTTSNGWMDPFNDGWPVYYKITATDFSGNESGPASPEPATGVVPVIPKSFALYQNVPNPFNPTTTIVYDVPPGSGRVTLRIYDVTGRLVREFVDDGGSPGRKQFVWDGRNDNGAAGSTGIYFCRMSAAGFEQTMKMLLLK